MNRIQASADYLMSLAVRHEFMQRSNGFLKQPAELEQLVVGLDCLKLLSDGVSACRQDLGVRQAQRLSQSNPSVVESDGEQ